MDEWKLARNLGKQAEQTVYNGTRASSFVEELEEQRRAELSYRTGWKNFDSEHIFDEEHRKDPEYTKKIIKEFIEYIQYCRKTKRPIEGKIGDIEFSVDPKDISRIEFSDVRREKTCITDGKDFYTEHIIAEDSQLTRFPEYDENLEAYLSRQIYVINGEEINEYITIEPKVSLVDLKNIYDYDKIQNNLVEIYLNRNPKYEKGENGEVYRLEIDENEEIPQLVADKREMETRGAFPNPWLDSKKSFPGGLKYKDCKKDSEEFRKKCEYLSKIISKASKALKIEKAKNLMDKSKAQDKEISNLQQEMGKKGTNRSE